MPIAIMLPISTVTVKAFIKKLINSWRSSVRRNASRVIIWIDKRDLFQKSYISLVGKSKMGVERSSNKTEAQNTDL